MEVPTTHLEDMALENELAESHYSRLHWARATMETLIRIEDVQEPVVSLVEHGSEINLMSMDFYKKGKWLINTKHGKYERRHAPQRSYKGPTKMYA